MSSFQMQFHFRQPIVFERWDHHLSEREENRERKIPRDCQQQVDLWVGRQLISVAHHKVGFEKFLRNDFAWVKRRTRRCTTQIKMVKAWRREKVYNKNVRKYLWFTLLGNKESRGGVGKKRRKDLNATQTWLNEKLLEVNICLGHVFPVMFPNYKAASCWALNVLASSNQRNWLSTSPQPPWWSNFALSHRRRS